MCGNAVSLEQENQNLKVKCNKLIDLLEVKEKEKEELEKMINLLHEELEKNKSRKGSEGQISEIKTAYSNELFLFMESFKNVIKSIIEDQAFIKYSNSSKNSSFYCKIEKDTFDSYIKNISDIEIKKFIEISIGFLFLKSEKNNKCVYPSDKLRVYFVNKAVVNVIEEGIGQLQPGE